MDVISDALRVLRLRGALFLNAVFREPWCVVAPSADELARVMPAPHEYVAVCHLVVDGRCWVILEGDREQEIALQVEAGDVVVFPHGDAHLVGCGRNNARAARSDAVMIDIPKRTRVEAGGTGSTTSVICGWFAYDKSSPVPVISSLPRVFRTSIRSRPSSHWLESSIRWASSEASSGGAGADVIAEKLAEVLFIEALRGHLETLAPTETGWLAAVRDPIVGRAVSAIHERPNEPWTVASLAQATHASRSVLAERFTAVMGMPPMQYLTQWRVTLASHLLRSGDFSLFEIATRVGYESEAAFSRAFKRAYGAPPGAWRRTAPPAAPARG